MLTNHFASQGTRETQQVNQLLAAAWMYLQAHMELDPEYSLLSMGWGKIAMAKFHQA